MKKLLLLLAGGIAVIVALSLTGPLIGLVISGLLVAAGMHYYVKSNSKFAKVMWILVGLAGVLSAISNIPALIGLAAIFILYVIYKKWNNEEVSIKTLKEVKEDDPFTNFEKEWSNLSR